MSFLSHSTPPWPFPPAPEKPLRGHMFHYCIPSGPLLHSKKPLNPRKLFCLWDSHVHFCLQSVAMYCFEIYKEILVSHRHVVGKGRDILIVFLIFVHILHGYYTKTRQVVISHRFIALRSLIPYS